MALFKSCLEDGAATASMHGPGPARYFSRMRQTQRVELNLEHGTGVALGHAAENIQLREENGLSSVERRTRPVTGRM